jgi:predicted negative regulator of RcsB-dependent stress response
MKNSKKMKRNGKKLTFGIHKLGVGAPTYTWQEGERKYHNKQGNTSNTYAKIITTIMRKKNIKS